MNTSILDYNDNLAAILKSYNEFMFKQSGSRSSKIQFSFNPNHRKGLILKKYKTFSVLIYSYINTSGNWKYEKLCGNTTPAVWSVFTQFRVFPIFTSVDITAYQYGKNVLYFFYNIALRTLTGKWRETFHVGIELYQHGS